MSRDDDWGPWLIHMQGPMPVKAGTVVMAEMNHNPDDLVGPLQAQDFDWDGCDDCVTRYSVQKPRALREMIERAESLTAQEGVEA